MSDTFKNVLYLLTYWLQLLNEYLLCTSSVMCLYNWIINRKKPLPSGNLHSSGRRPTIININELNIVCFMVVNFMMRKRSKERKGMWVNVGIQWLRLQASYAGDVGLIPGQGTEISHMPLGVRYPISPSGKRPEVGFKDIWISGKRKAQKEGIRAKAHSFLVQQRSPCSRI